MVVIGGGGVCGVGFGGGDGGCGGQEKNPQNQ